MSAEVIEGDLGSSEAADAGGAPSARNNATLGAEREDGGVLLSPRLVLTIGYLIMEADEWKSPTTRAAGFPAKWRVSTRRPGWASCVCWHRQGEPFVLGDAGALKEKDAVLAAGARGNIAPAFVTSAANSPAAGNICSTVRSSLFRRLPTGAARR